MNSLDTIRTLFCFISKNILGAGCHNPRIFGGVVIIMVPVCHSELGYCFIQELWWVCEFFKQMFVCLSTFHKINKRSKMYESCNKNCFWRRCIVMACSFKKSVQIHVVTAFCIVSTKHFITSWFYYYSKPDSLDWLTLMIIVYIQLVISLFI